LHTESFESFDGGSHAELDSLVASTSSLINSTKATLVRLGDGIKSSDSDAKQKVQHVNTQRRALQTRVKRYQQVEKTYRDKIRDRAVDQYRIGILLPDQKAKKIVNPGATNEEISKALSDPNTQIFQQALLRATRSSQARSALTEVKSRHNDILAIEKKIHELSQMFNELGVMVELQELPIDDAAGHAANTEIRIREGVKEVTRAEKYLRALRRKKWWCFGICVLIIIIIVVIVVCVTQINKN
jgi:syntaxin 1B/2/3